MKKKVTHVVRSQIYFSSVLIEKFAINTSINPYLIFFKIGEVGYLYSNSCLI